LLKYNKLAAKKEGKMDKSDAERFIEEDKSRESSRKKPTDDNPARETKEFPNAQSTIKNLAKK